MTLPNAQKLYAVIDGTWPSSAKQAIGPWTIRLDQSGSSRVSAATAELPPSANDIPMAEMAMREADQTPLFMIREGERALDLLLKEKGYVVRDPVNMFAAAVEDIATKRPPPVTCFEVWPPLTVQHEIWSWGGISDGRLDIMDRARHPKTTLLGRHNDRPAGTVFVSIAADCAMIHALEIAEDFRRAGLAANLTRAAAFWAKANGAAYLTLVTTRDNAPANALYASLGMTVVGQYHYRRFPE